MDDVKASRGTPQGFGPSCRERLPLPPREALDDAQRAAAAALIAGPRKAVLGPFIPLLRTPVLMERIGAVGETLRYAGSLPANVRELVICVVARETGNQFEWQTHQPLALQAGVAAAALEALAAGRSPRGLAGEEACAVDFAIELMRRHGVCDDTWAEVTAAFGEAAAVELTALIGYFTLVCWVMNVARTPGPAAASAPPLTAWPG